MKLAKIIKRDKEILIKILLAKILVLIFLFLVRPPQMIYDAEIYYNQTKNITQIFKPIGTAITEETKVKPPGWTLLLYPFHIVYPNWLFWAVFFQLYILIFHFIFFIQNSKRKNNVALFLLSILFIPFKLST